MRVCLFENHEIRTLLGASFPSALLHGQVGDAK